ncbi:ras GTPase-activating protein [Pisolithus orientalis]|uniref:ras GTPase-activating protein n=1 Tax=Pisolithus orientalis TaxID=936130 RepID=UPI002224ED69|nr:ras GTPase-activating protein [Pisolithus orientalis]KAI6035361.1 ras GTPase-activating protein [Pisolithus orientalis]
MERSNSISSLASNGSTRSRDSSSPFAYQTRLLEGTSPRSSFGVLSRNNSLASRPSPLAADAAVLSGSRRWAPSHRAGSSIDTVRGKWEERARAEAALEGRRSTSPNKERPRGDSLDSRVAAQHHSESVPSSSRPSSQTVQLPSQTTPTHLKRHTLSTNIVTKSSSPDATGPSTQNPETPTQSQVYSTLHRAQLTASTPDTTWNAPSQRLRRSNTLDNSVSPHAAARHALDRVSEPSSSPPITPPSMQSRPFPTLSHRPRPASLYDSPYSVSSPPEKGRHKPSSSPDLNVSPSRSLEQSLFRNQTSAASPSPSSSVMSPPPYRSSYMINKKASTYGPLGGRRKLGRHLPRIASGDVDENLEEENDKAKVLGVGPDPPGQTTYRRHDDPPLFPTLQDGSVQGVPSTDDVAGIPGRLRLSRDKLPSTPASPMPSSHLTRGLWADTQRHLLQAYEYLCHIGEAQQWIEGCLGEELGFGVVEMEEKLRNGVALAKLARAFQGGRVVRRIYEAPKLDFRHSDNINYFFAFVREVALPECFIFELTDLYEKKNIPKVIYCIHALSHLLARRGLAQRIGNLVGQLQFSDDQLQQTQKGLNDAGITMPNFGDVGRELAKEINEDPEVEIETEEERCDRLLAENEESICAVQCFARGFLIRKAYATQCARVRLAERYVLKVQAHCRGVLARRDVSHIRKAATDLTPWVISLQSLVRGHTKRQRWLSFLSQLRTHVGYVVSVQAQARGVLQRRRLSSLKMALRRTSQIFMQFQASARAKITRQGVKELSKTFGSPEIAPSVIAVQAAARGLLRRATILKHLRLLGANEHSILDLQAQCRGVLVRRRIRTQLAKLVDVSSTVVRIQAAARTYMARKRLLALIRGLRRATPAIIGLQARARAGLARQYHQNVNKALSEIKLVISVGSFQARARAALARNRHREQQKCLEFVVPDVTGMQAATRGYLVRREYIAWRTHLWKSQPVATMLQALLRGALQRLKFRAKIDYYRSHLDKVVKVQSLFRAKETREQYRQLTLGRNVTVGTIKNFVHLLDDSEADFQDEIKVERLRKKVVESIRENQALENDVSDLDVKIALVVQNVKSFEELVKARRKYGADNVAAHATRASILAAHGDPFAGPNTLDHAAKRKLELYQQLFYLLQTNGEYLSRLFVELTNDDSAEKHRPLAERVALTLFGYGQDRREDYLLLKLLQLCIRQEIASAQTVEDAIHGHPIYISIAVQYLRPKQVPYVRETVQPIIRELIEAVDLDLESDPSIIHRSRVAIEEMRSGVPSNKPKDVPFYEALEDPDTRAEYIRHLQKLQWWSEAFMSAILQSAKRVPYGMRFIARETLASLRERFPDARDTAYAACIARLVYYRYLNPAIIAPETFDIVTTTIDVATRKNLAQISQVLTQIASGSEFSEDSPRYLPINEMVRKSISQMTAWMLQLAEVPDAEAHYHAHEFLDVTVQPKPIYISPNEVYAMHGLLSKYQDQLSPSREDALRVILQELNGVPNIENDELKDARDKAITLELTNRFARVRDPQADEKALWVQAKRGVLAILRVQPAQDLVESLMKPVTEPEELRWEAIIADMDNEPANRRMPSTSGDAGYRLEDIRLLQFKEVKAHTIFYLLELEKRGKIMRDDGFQGILDAIASDIRSKHRKRLQRQQEVDSMMDALKHLNERKKYFQEQIDSYHNYVEGAMATMQRGKGKKRFVLPFTKQYFHLRDLQKSGKSPQFGSFRYSAKDLYEKGILLSVDQFSPRQFDKLDVIISSNKAGIFTMEVINNALGISNRIATADLRMEDLLQAQFENRASLSLFNGMVKVNLSLLLYQINKKFYV